ncbi:MAG: ankyrin repeat domain-containing protein, partial [Planctomycetota bacterium]
MARPGRPRKHDPVADEIRRHIRNADDGAAEKLVASTSVDVPDGENCTPLIWASFHNRPALFQWLIDRGANIDHQNRNGYCALHYVAQEKLPSIAEMLLNAGASTELRDAFGNTPLWTAAFNARGDLSVVKLLAEHGASFDNTNNAGKSIREMAMIFFPDELPALTRNRSHPELENRSSRTSRN